MTDVAEHLARGLSDVRVAERVVSIEPDGADGWTVRTEDGDAIRGAAVIATPPVPQTLALLEAGGVVPDGADELAPLTYEPCIAVMLVADGRSALDEPGAVRLGEGPVAWIADGVAKGISATGAVTVHLTAQASRAWWDHADDELGARVIAEVGGRLGVRLGPATVKRWRCAQPTTVLDARVHRASPDPPLLLAGDIFGGPLVEGAARSGAAAAAELVALWST